VWGKREYNRERVPGKRAYSRERERGKSDGLYMTGSPGQHLCRLVLAVIVPAGLGLRESRSGWDKVLTRGLLSPHAVRL
jgi:hypothetical protein